MTITDYLQLAAKELDNELDILISKLNSTDYSNYPIEVNSNLFSTIVTLKDDLKDKKDLRYKRVMGCGGVYLFECIKPCDIPEGVNLSRKWRESKKERLEYKDIVYVGKAKSLLRRIHNHYSNNYKNSSLCLNSKQKLKESCFMIIFVLKRQYDSYRDYILPYFENKMHEKLLYAIGNK